MSSIFTKSKELLRDGLLWTLFVYLLTILGFSLLYWLSWTGSPDRFIVNPEVNLVPIQSAESQLFGGDPSYLTSGSVESLVQLNKDVADQITKLDNLEHELAKLQDRLEAQEKVVKDIDAELESDRQVDIASYREEELRPLKEKEDRIEDEIRILNELIGQDGDELYASPLQVERSELNIELTKVRRKIAKKEVEISNDIIDHYADFGDPKLRAKAEAAHETLGRLDKDLLKTQRRIFDVRDALSDTYEQITEARVKSLGWVDFLYFSFSVSMAASFGDIVPNQTFVRGIVIVQLFVNFLLLGTLLHIITSRIAGQKVKRDKQS